MKIKDNKQVVCPLCGNHDIKIKWVNNDLEYVTCNICDLAFNHPLEMGESKEVGDASSSITNPSYNKMMKEEAVAREKAAYDIAKERKKAYESFLGYPPQSILDVGCGDGAFCLPFSKLGIEYTGIDVNASTVGIAQKLNRNVILSTPDKLFQEKGEELFDVINFSQVLEHIFQPVEFLNSIFLLLKPSGVVHIEVPNHNGIFPLLRKIKPRGTEYGFLQPPHHQIAYTKNALEFLLKETKLTPLWVEQKSDYHPIWGEVHAHYSFTKKIIHNFVAFFGMGSLLVGVARKPTSK